MGKIFLSHAVADRQLAELLVEFLMDAIGVPAKAIFCMSGFGVPLTHDFNEDMKDQIADADLVILLMTPAYLDSPFCLMEVGATWSRSLRPLPIVVPPVSFVDVTKTLGLKQAWEITNHEGLQGLRDTVIEALGLEPRENHIFDRKRERWKADLEVKLGQLAPATKVASAAYEAAVQDIEDLRAQLGKAKNQVTSLEKKLTVVQSLRPVAMIIEDEHLIALDLSQILNDAGYVVSGVARTERDAVEMAIRSRPDILLADIQLADGSSGIDAVNKIINIVDCYPVFITAFPERLLSGDRPEPVRLITKPFERELVLSIVKKAYDDLLSDRERSGGR